MSFRRFETIYSVTGTVMWNRNNPIMPSTGVSLNQKRKTEGASVKKTPTVKLVLAANRPPRAVPRTMKSVATMDRETKSFDLAFKAMMTGRYTLSMETQGYYNYIHLIDKIAGVEVDMLKDGEYSFFGSSADSEDRFVVRLAVVDDDEDCFAYQSGDNIVVCGTGELQIFDVTGRFVASYSVNGLETICKPSQKGVYILRLVGNVNKTQKIFVK